MTRYAASICAMLTIAALSLSISGCPEQTTTTTAVPATQPAPSTEPPAAQEPVPAEASGSGSVQTISYGEEVELSEYAAEGKTTIFDFYSDGCGPCKVYAPKLEALAEKRDDINLVVVDINRSGSGGIDWDSPVARQYSISSIPHLKVFGPDGKELAQGDEARAMVDGWM